MKIKSKYTMQEMFSVKPVTVKDVENIKNIPKIKKYLSTFLSNPDLLMKC